MSVTRQSFARSLLQALNLPTTNTNLQIIVAWTVAEGGAGPQFGVPGNTANYNPLNTKLSMPGSTDSGGGIQSYRSWKQGLDATTQTLAQQNMSAIVSMLQPGNATPGNAATTINSSPWGTRDLTPQLITGTSISSSDPGSPIVAGPFGPNTNPVSASLWYVGDEMNPDEDYWTCINRLGQAAQWYVFSDGETLYAADGIKLMGQSPTDVIILFDPRVVEAHLTFDNTSFNYTHTSIKKGKTVRKATLARTTSPTECEIKIICPIDKYRGGDVVELRGFGQAADGPWLVGECRRSVFEPYSTLTLVQGMAPLNAVSGLPLGPAYLSGSAATAAGAGTVINRMVAEAATINNKHFPYVLGGGHTNAGKPSGSPGNGFDCSGAVAAVLAAGGLWKEGSQVPRDDGLFNQLLANGILLPGQGTGNPECTLFDKPGDHIYMRLNGKYWGTWAGGADAPGGGGWCPSGYPMPGYRAGHVPASILGQQPAATGA